MKYTEAEVIQFVRENNVKFIRLMFCDIFGRIKNLSIMPEELERAFSEGISFDGSALQGFQGSEASDLFLYPDPSTLAVLPWRPSRGRVVRLHCRICYPDGRPYENDSRSILYQTAKRLEKAGFRCQIGPECEFYLFNLDDKGEPTKMPQDRGGYCDIEPLDRGENLRREICLTLEDMGLQPESSHHEQGPGQNEIGFKYQECCQAADDLMTFRSLVKALAAQNGLHACFMPKPLPGYSGSGLHINLSLLRQGKNLFASADPADRQIVESFLAGILERIREITVFLNPLTNSYRRFGAFEAPGYVSWGQKNRSQLIRIPAAAGELSRMELRSPDPAANPYLAFALVAEAGLEGIQRQLPLAAPRGDNLYLLNDSQSAGLLKLPATLGEALALAAESSFIRQVLPETLVRPYLKAKEEEWQACRQAPDQLLWEEMQYFPYI